jgi:hypothetical protein
MYISQTKGLQLATFLEFQKVSKNNYAGKIYLGKMKMDIKTREF